MSDVALPITIGVTGHRDPANPQAIKQVLDQVLTELQARFPHTPLQALSPLAEGADRLFAEVALDHGMPLDVVLPLRKDLYEHDFPESRDAFEALMAQARQIATLPIIDDHNEAGVVAGSLARDLHYAQVGFHVASRAQILIALWDGEPARGLGGTAQVVSMRLHGRPHAEGLLGAEHLLKFDQPSPIDEPEVGVVCWIQVRRSHRGKEDEADVAPPRWKIGRQDWRSSLPQRGSARGTALEHLDELDEYNHVLATHLPSLELTGHVDPIQQNRELAEVSPMVKRLYAQHLAADAMATGKMADVRHRFRIIFWLAGFMAAAFEIWAHVLPSYFTLLIYLLILGAVGVLVWRLRRTEEHERAVDWRILAEGLRVQAFWVASGLPDQVSRHYMRRHGPFLQWVRTALSGVLPVPPEVSAAGAPAVLKHWMEAQRDYYLGRVRDNKRAMHRLVGASRWAYGLGLALAILAFVLSLPFVHCLGTEESLRRALIVVTIGLLPVTSGLLNGYVEFAGYKDQAREYRRMGELFTRAIDQTSELRTAVPTSAKKLADFQRIVRDLGIEALREQADWALLHKTHDIEMPKG